MKATPRSALFQLNLVASSYPSWCGHHRVDSEIDLSPAQTISRKLGQHGGIILTGHWIEIDHTAPWHDTPDPHGGLADPQLAADPGVLDVRRGVAGVDKEWQPVISQHEILETDPVKRLQELRTAADTLVGVATSAATPGPVTVLP